MTAIPAGEIASRVQDILSDAEAIVALSRTNPGIFFEQKDGLVQRLKELHADVRDGEAQSRDRRPARTNTFRAGKVVTRQGRVVIAEVRRARKASAS